MLFWIYWLIVVAVLILSVRELYLGKDWRAQLSAAVVLIPLLLRAFLVK